MEQLNIPVKKKGSRLHHDEFNALVDAVNGQIQQSTELTQKIAATETAIEESAEWEVKAVPGSILLTTDSFSGDVLAATASLDLFKNGVRIPSTEENQVIKVSRVICEEGKATSGYDPEEGVYVTITEVDVVAQTKSLQYDTSDGNGVNSVIGLDVVHSCGSVSVSGQYQKAADVWENFTLNIPFSVDTSKYLANLALADKVQDSAIKDLKTTVSAHDSTIRVTNTNLGSLRDRVYQNEADIKTLKKFKWGFLYFNEAENVYLIFADEDSKDKYLETSDGTLILASFAAGGTGGIIPPTIEISKMLPQANFLALSENPYSFDYTVNGSGTKTVEFYLDGVKLPSEASETITAGNVTQTKTISELPQGVGDGEGVHEIMARVIAETDDGKLYSPIIVRGFYAEGHVKQIINPFKPIYVMRAMSFSSDELADPSASLSSVKLTTKLKKGETSNFEFSVFDPEKAADAQVAVSSEHENDNGSTDAEVLKTVAVQNDKLFNVPVTPNGEIIGESLISITGVDRPAIDGGYFDGTFEVNIAPEDGYVDETNESNIEIIADKQGQYDYQLGGGDTVFRLESSLDAGTRSRAKWRLEGADADKVEIKLSNSKGCTLSVKDPYSVGEDITLVAEVRKVDGTTFEERKKLIIGKYLTINATTNYANYLGTKFTEELQRFNAYRKTYKLVYPYTDGTPQVERELVFGEKTLIPFGIPNGAGVYFYGLTPDFNEWLAENRYDTTVSTGQNFNKQGEEVVSMQFSTYWRMVSVRTDDRGFVFDKSLKMWECDVDRISYANGYAYKITKKKKLLAEVPWDGTASAEIESKMPRGTYYFVEFPEIEGYTTPYFEFNSNNAAKLNEGDYVSQNATYDYKAKAVDPKPIEMTLNDIKEVKVMITDPSNSAVIDWRDGSVTNVADIEATSDGYKIISHEFKEEGYVEGGTEVESESVSYSNKPVSVKYGMDKEDLTLSEISDDGITAELTLKNAAIYNKSDGAADIINLFTIEGGAYQRSERQGVKLQPSRKNNGQVIITIHPINGLKFTPKKISFYVNKCGTDGTTPNLRLYGEADGVETLINEFDALRYNYSATARPDTEKDHIVLELTEQQQKEFSAAESFVLNAIIRLPVDRQMAFNDFTIDGVLNGETSGDGGGDKPEPYHRESNTIQISNCNEVTMCMAAPSSLVSYDTIGTSKVKNLNFKNCVNLTEVGADVFKNDVSRNDFSQVFAQCTSLSTLPEELFSRCRAATSFAAAFMDTTVLNTLPNDLFSKTTAVTTFVSCFSGSGVAMLPKGLFENCVEVTSYNGTFENCKSLIAAAGVFGDCDKVTSFDKTFGQCAALKNVDFVNAPNASYNGYATNDTALEQVNVLDGKEPVSAFATAFENTNSTFVISVPADKVDEYKTATGWAQFADRIVSES